jgi:hypothetical protein
MTIPFRSRQWPALVFLIVFFPVILLLAVVGSRWVKWL